MASGPHAELAMDARDGGITEAQVGRRARPHAGPAGADPRPRSPVEPVRTTSSTAGNTEGTSAARSWVAIASAADIVERDGDLHRLRPGSQRGDAGSRDYPREDDGDRRGLPGRTRRAGARGLRPAAA